MVIEPVLTLRARLERAGLIGPEASAPFRLVSCSCVQCRTTQHVLVAAGDPTHCIACDAWLSDAG